MQIICHHDLQSCSTTIFLGSECGVIRKWWWRLGVFSLHRLRGRPHSSIGSHSLACWSNQLQNSIVAAAELQLSAYMHRKASSAVTSPPRGGPPRHCTTPLPLATGVPDEERSIEAPSLTTKAWSSSTRRPINSLEFFEPRYFAAN